MSRFDPRYEGEPSVLGSTIGLIGLVLLGLLVLHGVCW